VSLALASVVVATLLRVPNRGLLATGLLGGALALSVDVQAMLWAKYDPAVRTIRPVTALRALNLAIVLISRVGGP